MSELNNSLDNTQNRKINLTTKQSVWQSQGPKNSASRSCLQIKAKGVSQKEPYQRPLNECSPTIKPHETSLAVQWLRRHTCTVEGPGWIPDCKKKKREREWVTQALVLACRLINLWPWARNLHSLSLFPLLENKSFQFNEIKFMWKHLVKYKAPEKANHHWEMAYITSRSEILLKVLRIFWFSLVSLLSHCSLNSG